MRDNLFQKSWKISSRPLSSFSPIFSSFQIHFEWLKTWWVHQPRLYKTSLHSRGKDAIIKDFKFKTLIHSSLNTEHPMSSSFLFTKSNKNSCLPQFFTGSSNYCSIRSARWRVTNILWPSEAEDQCVRFNLLTVLTCSPAYIPYSLVTHPSPPGKGPLQYIY